MRLSTWAHRSSGVVLMVIQKLFVGVKLTYNAHSAEVDGQIPRNSASGKLKSSHHQTAEVGIQTPEKSLVVENGQGPDCRVVGGSSYDDRILG